MDSSSPPRFSYIFSIGDTYKILSTLICHDCILGVGWIQKYIGLSGILFPCVENIWGAMIFVKQNLDIFPSLPNTFWEGVLGVQTPTKKNFKGFQTPSQKVFGGFWKTRAYYGVMIMNHHGPLIVNL